jgi:hypothetical protein
LDLRGEKASVKLLEAIQSATGDGARAPNSEHRALTDAIAHYNQGPSEKDITTPSLSDAAQELRQLIEKETNLEDRGIVHILTEIEPGMTMFFPRIQYSGSPLRMKSRLFRQAIEELVAGGFLCPPEVNPSTNTQTFECRTKN